MYSSCLTEYSLLKRIPRVSSKIFSWRAFLVSHRNALLGCVFLVAHRILSSDVYISRTSYLRVFLESHQILCSDAYPSCLTEYSLLTCISLELRTDVYSSGLIKYPLLTRIPRVSTKTVLPSRRCVFLVSHWIHVHPSHLVPTRIPHVGSSKSAFWRVSPCLTSCHLLFGLDWFCQGRDAR